MSRFHALPPPPDGLAVVLREGRRRRRQRTALSASAAAVAVVALLAVAVLAAPGSRTDSLRPEPYASAGPVDSPVPAPAAEASPAPEQAPAPAPAAGGAVGTDPRAQAPAQPQATPAPQQAPQEVASAYRTPDLVRAYDGPPRTARLCGAAYDSDGGGGSQVGWCLAAVTARTPTGTDLVLELCRADAAGAGRLTYPTDHEVDLVVRAGEREVWRWSAGRPPQDDPHALDADVGGCWSWRAPWTAVDGAGRPLPAGSYALVARTHAQELQGVAEARVDFSL